MTQPRQKFTGPDLGSSEIEGSRKRHLNLDIRVNAQGNIARVIEANRTAGGMDVAGISKTALEQVNTIDRGLKTLKLRVPDAEAKLSPLTGALELLRSPGTLSGPAPGQSGEAIVRGFVRDNKSLYGLSSRQIDGLNFPGESVSGRSGLRMVRAEQMLNGYPIFQSETRFLIDREGRLVRSVGAMILKASAPLFAPDGLIKPREALRSAMASLDV